VAIFIPISKSGATNITILFLRLKLQNFATMIYKVANKNLKIDPEFKSGAPSITLFFGVKITTCLKLWLDNRYHFKQKP
jgi:hypothetical protein